MADTVAEKPPLPVSPVPVSPAAGGLSLVLLSAALTLHTTHTTAAVPGEGSVTLRAPPPAPFPQARCLVFSTPELGTPGESGRAQVLGFAGRGGDEVQVQGRLWEVWGREVVRIRSPFWKDHSGCQMERELEGAGRQGGPGGPWGASPLPSERGRSLGSLGGRGGERNSQARAPTGGSFGRTP